MQAEKLEFVGLDELKQDLLTEDPSFEERLNAHKAQQQMIKALKEARLEMNLSQADIAQRTGIKTQNISRLERGIVSPSFETLARYAHALGATIKLDMPNLKMV